MDTSRVLRQMEYILQFDFKVVSVPGNQNGVADFLSRTGKEEAEAIDYLRHIPQSVFPEQGQVEKMVWGDIVDLDILLLAEADPEYREIINQVKKHTRFKYLPEHDIL